MSKYRIVICEDRKDRTHPYEYPTLEDASLYARDYNIGAQKLGNGYVARVEPVEPEAPAAEEDIFAEDELVDIPDEWRTMSERHTDTDGAPSPDELRRRCNWAVRQAAACDKDIATVDAELAERLNEFNLQIQAACERADEMRAPAVNKRSWLVKRYETTMRNLLEVENRASLKLMDGTIKIKVDNQPNIAVKDEAALRAYVAAQNIRGVFVPTTGEKFLITPLKDAWKATKVVPPGCVEVPGKSHLEIEPFIAAK